MRGAAPQASPPRGTQAPGGPPCAGPHRGGEKAANDWGLYDVIGNVFEWVWDWYGLYQGDAVDPLGPPNGVQRAMRGGSWYRDGRSCRSAYRAGAEPAAMAGEGGFRLVRTAIAGN